MTKPLFWRLFCDGKLMPDIYPQRARANGAALILRANGSRVRVVPYFGDRCKPAEQTREAAAVPGP